jgi:hypothetical protein
MSYGKMADAMSCLFHDDDGACLQDAGTVRQDRPKPFKDVLCPRVVETKYDHACLQAARERRDLSEVEVKRDDDSSFGDGLREYLAVRQPLQTFISKVHRFMSLLAQPSSNADIHAHVQQESHEQVSAVLPEMNLLLSEPRGVAECLLDVLPLEVRVSGENLLERGAVSDLADDHRHGDPNAADASPSAEHLGVKRDPVKFHLDTSVGVHSIRSSFLPHRNSQQARSTSLRAGKQVSIWVSITLVKYGRSP